MTNKKTIVLVTILGADKYNNSLLILRDKIRRKDQLIPGLYRTSEVAAIIYSYLYLGTLPQKLIVFHSKEKKNTPIPPTTPTRFLKLLTEDIHTYLKYSKIPSEKRKHFTTFLKHINKNSIFISYGIRSEFTGFSQEIYEKIAPLNPKLVLVDISRGPKHLIPEFERAVQLAISSNFIKNNGTPNNTPHVIFLKQINKKLEGTEESEKIGLLEKLLVNNAPSLREQTLQKSISFLKEAEGISIFEDVTLKTITYQLGETLMYFWSYGDLGTLIKYTKHILNTPSLSAIKNTTNLQNILDEFLLHHELNSSHRLPSYLQLFFSFLTQIKKVNKEIEPLIDEFVNHFQYLQNSKIHEIDKNNLTPKKLARLVVKEVETYILPRLKFIEFLLQPPRYQLTRGILLLSELTVDLFTLMLVSYLPRITVQIMKKSGYQLYELVYLRSIYRAITYNFILSPNIPKQQIKENEFREKFEKQKEWRWTSKPPHDMAMKILLRNYKEIYKCINKIISEHKPILKENKKIKEIRNYIAHAGANVKNTYGSESVEKALSFCRSLESIIKDFKSTSFL